MKKNKDILNYLIKNNLILTTAESCTGGRIVHLISKLASAGSCLDSAFVVYSKEAKKKTLGVKSRTIKQFTLTSEEVAKEMALGALKKTSANIAIASTGIAGSKPMDGVEPGTICFAWAFKQNDTFIFFSITKRFSGSRAAIQTAAAEYALEQIPFYFNQLIKPT